MQQYEKDLLHVNDFLKDLYIFQSDKRFCYQFFLNNVLLNHNEMTVLIHHYLNDNQFQEFLLINIWIYHYKNVFAHLNIDKKDQLLWNVLHLIHDKFLLNIYLAIMFVLVHIHYEYLLIHDNVHQNLVMLNDQIEFEIFFFKNNYLF